MAWLFNKKYYQSIRIYSINNVNKNVNKPLKVVYVTIDHTSVNECLFCVPSPFSALWVVYIGHIGADLLCLIINFEIS